MIWVGHLGQVLTYFSLYYSQHTYPSSNLEIIIIGPNDSSCDKNVLSFTSVNTVGSKKYPVKVNIKINYTNDHQLLNEKLKQKDHQFFIWYGTTPHHVLLT